MPDNEKLNDGHIIGKRALDDIRRLNDVNGVGEVVVRRTISNLGFVGLALGGEVGELQNIIKKMWRDGESEKLWAAFDEEVVDVIIYLGILLDISHTDLLKAWETKFKELELRFESASPSKWSIDKAERPLLREIAMPRDASKDYIDTEVREPLVREPEVTKSGKGYV